VGVVSHEAGGLLDPDTSIRRTQEPERAEAANRPASEGPVVEDLARDTGFSVL